MTAASVIAIDGDLIENTHKAYKFCAVCSSKTGLDLVQVNLTWGKNLGGPWVLCQSGWDEANL